MAHLLPLYVQRQVASSYCTPRLIQAPQVLLGDYSYRPLYVSSTAFVLDYLSEDFSIADKILSLSGAEDRFACCSSC